MTISVDWEITKRCNETCSFCLNASGPDEPDILSTNECYRIIDQLVDIGVFHMVITGGEPFIRPDIQKIFSYAASKNLIWTVTTNGSLLNHDVLTTLIPIRAHFRSLQISLHSLDKATYERYKISPNELENTKNGIIAASQLGFTTTVICLFNGQNENEVLEVYDWCTKHGIYGFISSSIKSSGRAKNDYSSFRSDTEKWMSFLERLFSASRGNGKPTLLISEPPLIQEYINKKLKTGLLPYSCPAGTETFMIKGNGDVYPCPFISHDCTGNVESNNYCAGNVRSLSLKEMLNGKIFNAFNTNVDSATTYFGVKDVKCSGCGKKGNGQCRPCQLGVSDCHDSVRAVTDVINNRKTINIKVF